MAEERRSVRASRQASAGNEDRRAYGKTLYPRLQGKLIPRTIHLPLFTEKIHNLLQSYVWKLTLSCRWLLLLLLFFSARCHWSSKNGFAFSKWAVRLKKQFLWGMDMTEKGHRDHLWDHLWYIRDHLWDVWSTGPPMGAAGGKQLRHSRIRAEAFPLPETDAQWAHQNRPSPPRARSRV